MSREYSITRGTLIIEQYCDMPLVDADSPQDIITDVLLALEDLGEDTDSILRMAINNFEEER